MKLKKKRYVIVDSAKFLTVMTVFIAVTITMMIPIFKVNAKDTPDFIIESIYINDGDTLWHISEKYTPKDMDIRLYLDNLIQLNKIKTMILYPGDILYIPIYDD